MNINKVFILGRVTANPELRSTKSGQAVVSIGVATNRTWTKDGQKNDEVEFHNVVIFGRQAEVATQFLQKGSLVFIEGRLATRTFEQGGYERRATEIICENLQLGPKPAGEKGISKQETLPANPPAAQRAKDLAEEEKLPALEGDEEDTGRDFESAFGDEEIKPEEIPF